MRMHDETSNWFDTGKTTVSFTTTLPHTQASHSLNHYKFYQLESQVKTTESFNQLALAKVARTNSCLVN